MSAITKTCLLFQNPYNRPLSAAGQCQAGCYLVFQSGGALAPVYRDAALTWPYNQTSIPGSGPSAENSVVSGIIADGSGRFDPIYLNPAILYSYTLYSAAGAVLETGTNINVANTYQTLEAVKVSATSQTNTTTLIPDPDLQINIPALPNGAVATYRVEADLFFSATPASSTLLLEITFTGTTPPLSPNVVVLYGELNGAYIYAGFGINGPGGYTVNTNPLQNRIRLVGTVQLSSGGTFQVAWAQSVASLNVLSMLAGSALTLTPL